MTFSLTNKGTVNFWLKKLYAPKDANKFPPANQSETVIESFGEFR